MSAATQIPPLDSDLAAGGAGEFSGAAAAIVGSVFFGGGGASGLGASVTTGVGVGVGLGGAGLTFGATLLSTLAVSNSVSTESRRDRSGVRLARFRKSSASAVLRIGCCPG